MLYEGVIEKYLADLESKYYRGKISEEKLERLADKLGEWYGVHYSNEY